MLSRLRVQGLSQAAIARWMQRHPSTIGRELKRNGTTHDGRYRVEKAIMKANGRRSRSRRNQRFTSADLHRIEALLVQQWSPEQISGYLSKTGLLRISHETIYRHIWHDRRHGGELHQHLRGARKLRRKRYQHYDSRGRLAGKRHISERPLAAEQRACVGHWEIDTVIGHANKHCIVSLVDGKSGFVQIGKLNARTAEQTTQRTIDLINRQPTAFRTITADNGTEFHSYTQIERATGVRFYSPSRTTPGSAERTKTPTGLSANICQSDAVWPTSLSNTAMSSPTNSTPGRANDSTIKPQRSASMETDQRCASKLKLSVIRTRYARARA